MIELIFYTSSFFFCCLLIVMVENAVDNSNELKVANVESSVELIPSIVEASNDVNPNILKTFVDVKPYLVGFFDVKPLVAFTNVKPSPVGSYFSKLRDNEINTTPYFFTVDTMESWK
jgi:hypothetical protein